MTINQKHEQAAEVLKLMANPSRLRILFTLLEESPMSVSALNERLNIDQSVLSHNLVKLKDHGLLFSHRQGKSIHYSLANPELVRHLNEIFIKMTRPD